MAEIGLQLYTVRDHLQKDFIGTLGKVAEIGYRHLEFAGYGNMAAKDLRKALDDLGLRAVSAHAGAVLREPLREIEYAQELGIAYLVFPWLPEEMRRHVEDYRALGERLNEVGATCAAHGITLCYHNHAFEFERVTQSGEYGFDLLYAAAAPENLQAELDTYWIERADLSAIEYLDKMAGRCPLAHLKDMAAGDGREFAELGAGILPIADIAAAARKAGARYLFVEQDICRRDSLESVAASLAFLKREGIM